MYNKNISLALITIFTYLSFITCTTGEKLSIPKTGDAVTSISSEKEYDLESMIQFKNIIQFVIDKLLALDQKSWKGFRKDLRCDGCNCDDLSFLCCSVPTKIIICKGHSKQIDIWEKLFSSDKEPNCTCEKTKKPVRWIDDMRWIDRIWDIVTIGVFYKYFYFYNSDHCKGGSDVKKCGCKILKNATTECMEVCLCKTHFELLKAWEWQIFYLSMRKG
jgi:hypothetical protein